ncbi:MAG: hypothetical protein KGN39_07255 [Betaproteobacteria bacterium]|nr:hypothetical protein [Betaproteobacteria bacterium]
MKIEDSQIDIACRRSAFQETDTSSSTSSKSDGQWHSFKELLQQSAKDGKPLPDSLTGGSSGPWGQVPESWGSASLAASEASRQQRCLLMLQEIIARMFAALTGNPCSPDHSLEDFTRAATADASAVAPEGSKDRLAPAPTAKVQEVEWQHEATTHTLDQEATNVCAGGSVHTADGRCIDFKLEVSMARKYESTTAVRSSGTQYVLKDPLVINFDGQATDLQDARFSFDLNGDGRAEDMPLLGKGSAFLALDRNGDGKINDGKELFGAQSGDGFADLAKLDSDGNHWLDENDPAYAKLRVWRPGSKAEDGLETLQQAGVGALWLGSVASPFSLKDGNNQSQGEVRQTGLWLKEDGQVGALQQVDLAVSGGGSGAAA